MAKNTRSAAFRKIDVDEYNEDNYKEEEPEVQTPSQGPDEREVAQLLNQGKATEALKLCLRNAPLGSKSQQVKVTSFVTAGLKLFNSASPSFYFPQDSAAAI